MSESEPIVDDGERADGVTVAQARAIRHSAFGIGFYAGAFGLAFGAIAATSGLKTAQTLVLSLVMFTGASQLALAGVVAGGGGPLSAITTALLLGLRNSFYAVSLADLFQARGLRRLRTAHFVIDETTAMTVAQSTPPAARLAYWTTGLTLYVCWVAGSLAGALIGRGVNTTDVGLSAAAPAIFLSLLAPQLRRSRAVQVAVVAALVAFVLIPLVPAGVPVIAAAVVAVVGGLVADPDSRTSGSRTSGSRRDPGK